MRSFALVQHKAGFAGLRWPFLVPARQARGGRNVWSGHLPGVEGRYDSRPQPI